MKVELIAMSQPLKEIPQNVPYNPICIVERCASVCYDSQPTKDFKIAKGCAKSGHWSAFEFIVFTIHIEGVSRSLLAQLSRHRHISLLVQSQRYVKLNKFDAVKPLFEEEQSNIIFNDAMIDSLNKYSTLIELGEKLEDARSVLPNACVTELYMTVNARALVEISHLRLCNRAQNEIRLLFNEIKKEVARYCPEVASYMVPSCEQYEVPFCLEHKGCGKYNSLSKILEEAKQSEADGTT